MPWQPEGAHCAHQLIRGRAVGFTRKLMSVSSMGLVDFRSDKERTAAYTQAAKREAKKQTQLMRQQTEAARATQQAAERASAAIPPATPAPQLPPAGWYPDPKDQSVVRWFDGTQWTDFTQPHN